MKYLFHLPQVLFDDYNPLYDCNIEDLIEQAEEEEDYILCNWCNGSGEMYDGSERKCYKCNGLGVLFNV